MCDKCMYIIYNQATFLHNTTNTPKKLTLYVITLCKHYNYAGPWLDKIQGENFLAGALYSERGPHAFSSATNEKSPFHFLINLI